MSSNNTRTNVLARANATATDVFERDTYEAESPGDLAFIVSQLHDLVDEDYGSVSDLLKESLNHVTFRHDVNRIQSSGLYELLEVNPTNIRTSEYALFNYAFPMAKTKQIIRSTLRSPIIIPLHPRVCCSRPMSSHQATEQRHARRS
jgi:hypothetical protein